MYEIQAWLSELPDRTSFPTPLIECCRMPRTPSPTKRRRLEGTWDDNDNDNDEARNDATPRPTSLPTGHSFSSRDDTSSNVNNQPFSAKRHALVSHTSSQSLRSSRSSQSSRSQSSPIKRDLAMRFARDLPIQYRSISSAPVHIQPLVEQLVDLESKQGILPGRLRSAIQAYQSPSEPIRYYMFDDLQCGQGSEVDMRTLDRELERLLEVRDNTQECNSRARVFHEVEWNETVHSPMLRLVTKRIATLACRNLYASSSL
jgi:hypothetical protein